MNVARTVTLAFSMAALVGGGLVVYNLSQMPSNPISSTSGIISTAELSESAMGRPVEEPAPDLILFCGKQENVRMTNNELDTLTEMADKTFWNYETKVMRITGASARGGSDQPVLMVELRESIEWYAAELRSMDLPKPENVDNTKYRDWCEAFRGKHRKIPEKCRRYYKKTLIDGSGTAPSH